MVSVGNSVPMNYATGGVVGLTIHNIEGESVCIDRYLGVNLRAFLASKYRVYK
jgi:hypothetical protein